MKEERNLIKNYCRRNNLPLSEEVKNTLGFQIYRFGFYYKKAFAESCKTLKINKIFNVIDKWSKSK